MGEAPIALEGMWRPDRARRPRQKEPKGAQHPEQCRGRAKGPGRKTQRRLSAQSTAETRPEGPDKWSQSRLLAQSKARTGQGVSKKD